MNYQTPTLRRALAADYAIGLMPAAARQRFERLLQEDPALRWELAQWQESLASLTDSVPDQPLPDRLWQGITERIEPQRWREPEKRSIWHDLRLMAAACSLVVVVVLSVIYSGDTPLYSATLLSADAQPALKIDAHEHYLNVEPLALAAVDQGRSLQLWAIAEHALPVSLGVIPVGGSGKVELNEAQQVLLDRPVTLAVSLEPQGGSPTGQPTGPVLYKGVLTVF